MKTFAFRTHAAACLGLGLLLAAWTASAVDGVIEINQTCAVNGGCFTGDAGGFPVSITTSGSYRLTSNITPSGGADAISVGAEDVTIDLNGFRLIGSGGGIGISAEFQPYVTIRNGTVRTFLVGLVLGSHARVENVNVYGCTSDGILGDAEGGFLTGNQIIDNGGTGLKVFPDTVYRDNVITGNSPDVNGGIPLAENHCSDQTCSAYPRGRRYYLTNGQSDGASANQACETGFHFASMWEISDPSNLTYDTGLGLSYESVGPGPPTWNFGWIRTGFTLTGNTGGPGQATCGNWTSNASNYDGTAVRLEDDWSSTGTTGDVVTPWYSFTRACNQAARVWCVED